MADIDDLIEEALAEKEDASNSNLAASSSNIDTAEENQENVKKDEPAKSNAPVYRRVKKGEKIADPIKETVVAAVEEAKAAAPPSPAAVPATAPSADSEEKKESLDDLKAKLRAKRQGLIQQRTAQKMKEKTGALTPIFYCDTDGCKKITSGNGMCCPKCRCFYYCSKECQVADWEKHKDMCGKTPTPEGLAKLEVYIKARDAAQTLYEKTKKGDYITVLNEKADANMPACMFASVAEKSNVLFWRTYMQNPIFTTAKPDTIGTLAYKLQAAMDAFPNKKVYLISVLLDRIRDEKTTECVLRFFIADAYGGTMDSPANGKITKSVTRYVRKGK